MAPLLGTNLVLGSYVRNLVNKSIKFLVPLWRTILVLGSFVRNLVNESIRFLASLLGIEMKYKDQYSYKKKKEKVKFGQLFFLLIK